MPCVANNSRDGHNSVLRTFCGLLLHISSLCNIDRHVRSCVILLQKFGVPVAVSTTLKFSHVHHHL
jgi:hypothetical protein